ncbi:MAG: PD-(D/E)XK nuclease family protein [Acidimicrobiia bacterium]
MVVQIPPVIPGEPLKVSASTYVTWRECPERAAARFRGYYGKPSRAGFTGGLAHRIFSRHLREGPISDGEFEQVCREEIGASNLTNQMGDLGIRPSTLREIVGEVQSLYRRFVAFPDEGFEGAEVDLDYESDPDLELVGRIDAVYRPDRGGHRLVDWKTGELGDPSDQLLFYGLLWALAREEVPAELVAVSVATGERFEEQPSEEDLMNVAAEVAELVNQVRRSWEAGTDLERIAGPWCRYCPVLEECSEGQAAEALLANPQ